MKEETFLYGILIIQAVFLFGALIVGGIYEARMH